MPDRTTDAELRDHPDEPGASPDLIRTLFENCRVRVDLLVRHQICLTDRTTYVELGSELGMTSVRVGRIIEQAAEQISQLTTRPPHSALAQRAADLADRIGSAAPLDSDLVTDALAAAAEGLEPAEEVPTAELLLWLAGPYDLRDGWLIRRDRHNAGLADELNGALAIDSFVATRQDLEEAFGRLDIRTSLMDTLLSYTGGWRQIDDDTWVRWPGTVGEKAEIVLELVGRPCTPERILELIDEPYARRSLTNMLNADDRFVKTDKEGSVGLARWGLQEYSGLVNEIIKRLEKAGGRLRVNDLLDEMSQTLDVSASALRLNMYAPVFSNRDGWISIRRDDDPLEVSSDISRKWGAYRRPNGEMILHFAVDSQALRGSSRGITWPAAPHLGLSPGEVIRFESDQWGQLRLSWPTTSTNGPRLSSIRRIILGLGLEKGDVIRIVLDSATGTFTAEGADQDSFGGLTGLQAEPGEELDTLAGAMGIDADQVPAALRARGEDLLLEMLQAQESPGAG